MRLLITMIGMTAVAIAPVQASPFASQVIDYTPGSGAGSFDDPIAALGEPTRVTQADTVFATDVTPFQPAFSPGEVVTIGQGGQLTVKFDRKIRDNAAGVQFGIDLLVFGNSFYSGFTTAGSAFTEPGDIAVSQDGLNWFDVGPKADTPLPTMGFTDTTSPFGSDGVTATSFTIAVDPSFDPVGLTLAQIQAGYNGAGGGTGIDIASVGLDWIQYVRVTNPAGSGITPEVDGFADVMPDLTGDGQIDQFDLNLLLDDWKGAGGKPTDLNGDHLVDSRDLGLLLIDWTGSQSPELGQIPEPASAMLAVVCGMTLLPRRRR